MRMEQLYYFVVTSEEPSMNIAADKLFITQQSLNNAITAMEKELGYKLLNRSNRGISLTDKGILVKKAASDVLNIWSQLQTDLSVGQIDSSESTTLKFCVSPRNADLIMPKFINSFRTEHPNIEFICAEEHYLDILNGNIDTSAYDIIFNTLYIKKHNYLEHYNETVYSNFTPLFEHKPYLFCNTNSPVAKQKYISVASLKDLPIRAYASSKTSRLSTIAISDFYKKLGLDDSIIISDSLPYCLQGALDNLFYFFCVQGLTARMFDCPELVAVPVRLPFKIYFGYLTIPNQPLSPIAQQFINSIAETVNDKRFSI